MSYLNEIANRYVEWYYNEYLPAYLDYMWDMLIYGEHYEHIPEQVEDVAPRE